MNRTVFHSFLNPHLTYSSYTVVSAQEQVHIWRVHHLNHGIKNSFKNNKEKKSIPSLRWESKCTFPIVYFSCQSIKRNCKSPNAFVFEASLYETRTLHTPALRGCRLLSITTSSTTSALMNHQKTFHFPLFKNGMMTAPGDHTVLVDSWGTLSTVYSGGPPAT